ncbi:MAG: methyltransferase domain-containing protein [Bacteriovoracaceae bacterium]|nr:methyltransferase domain-containing protein [Bacteriovoracaceae bacterium]
MFKSPMTQWEIILTKPLEKQIKFLKKVCKVTRNDELVTREAFFDNLSFPLTKKIFKLVRNVVATGAIDFSFQQIIFDHFFGICDISDLYPEDREAENNIISGEGYHVYTASYTDLDLIIEFIKSRDDIHSLCDLGSGSGRALLYMALEINRQIEFMGLELVNDRVEYTNLIVKKFELQNLSFKTSNFLETPEDFLGFDSYYLYDPVGTDDVSLLISYFEKMINDGSKFYILFLSGWDDLMLDALNGLESLELIDSHSSRKQKDRYINFYKVI